MVGDYGDRVARAFFPQCDGLVRSIDTATWCRSLASLPSVVLGACLITESQLPLPGQINGFAQNACRFLGGMEAH